MAPSGQTNLNLGDSWIHQGWRPSKTPGFDNISKELLRLLLADPDSIDSHELLMILKYLCNEWYNCPYVSKIAGEAWIKLISKPKKFPTRYENKRPITIINEIPKLVLSILAKRINNVVCAHNLLSDTNFAYLHHKSVDNCLNIVLDIFEDARAHSKPLVGFSQINQRPSIGNNSGPYN